MPIRLVPGDLPPVKRDVSACVLPRTNDVTMYDLRATKIWTPKKETTSMAETYNIHIAENGYVIRRQGYSGDEAGDMQIAAEGDLEAQLNVFRVKSRLADSQRPAVCAPAPSKLPKDVAAELKALILKGHIAVPTDLKSINHFMGYPVSEADFKEAMRP